MMKTAILLIIFWIFTIANGLAIRIAQHHSRGSKTTIEHHNHSRETTTNNDHGYDLGFHRTISQYRIHGSVSPKSSALIKHILRQKCLRKYGRFC